MRALFAVALLACAASPVPAAPAVPSGAQATAAGQQAHQDSAPAQRIVLHGELLSVDLERAPLAETLREVARHSGVKLTLAEPLAGELSMKFERLPLRQGFAELLRGRSFILISAGKAGPGAAAHPRLAEVRVLSARAPDAGAPLAPRPAPQPVAAEPLHTRGFIPKEDALKVLQKRLDEPGGINVSPGVVKFLGQNLEKSQDLEERRNIADVLRKIGGPDVIGPLTQALQDPDEQVRQTAVDALRENGERVRLVVVEGREQWIRD